MRLLAALALPTLVSIPSAAADGETSPLFGASLVGATTSTASSSAAGLELEAASWHSWFGFALEASARAPLGGDDSSAVALGGSIRVRLMQALVPSLLEPSDVEVAFELQAIAERTLWNGALVDEPYRAGVGLALRLRGSTDFDTPGLITESRFFIRVMSAPPHDAQLAARTMDPAAPADRELLVLVGIGAAFGGGDPRYLQRFASHAFADQGR